MEIFEEIDHTVNLDIDNRGVRQLYRVTKDENPLCLKSARVLKEGLEEEEDFVGITTGFPVGPEKKPETDGPPGAVMLGKAVKEFGMEPIFMVEKFNLNVIENLLDLTGLEDAKIITIPTERRETENFCDRILSDYNFTSLISIEKPGIASNGKYHDMIGNNISSQVGKIDEIFIRASDSGIPTVGIGDGGNEIGMGNVQSTVEDRIAKGADIATITEVDYLVTAGVSNWGAYGILSALSRITDEQFLHDGDFEKRLIKTCVESGAVDGISKKPEFSVDSLHCNFHAHMVEILRYLGSR